MTDQKAWRARSQDRRREDPTTGADPEQAARARWGDAMEGLQALRESGPLDGLGLWWIERLVDRAADTGRGAP